MASLYSVLRNDKRGIPNYLQQVSLGGQDIKEHGQDLLLPEFIDCGRLFCLDYLLVPFLVEILMILILYFDSLDSIASRLYNGFSKAITSRTRSLIINKCTRVLLHSNSSKDH